jgi:hypothetical protein
MTKSNLRTAPQILEHYSLHCDTDDYMLRAMRHYNRTKIERLKDKLREEVKDEMYEEAYQNILKQYNHK